MINLADMVSEDHWGEFVDNDSPLPEKISSLLTQSILLPDQSIQLPIATCYLVLPSAFLKACKATLPLLFCWGQSGSGKSTLGLLASAIYGGDILNSASSFASIRNQLEEYSINQHYALVWDDCSPDTFRRDERLLAMLKGGISPKTSIIKIAKEGGENQPFDTYSPKIFSSIHPFFQIPTLIELKRRMIVILHKPSHSKRDFLNLDDLDFSGLTEELEEFWDDERKHDLLAYKRRLKSSPRREEIDSARFKISLDLMAVGLASGIFETVHDAFDKFVDYWSFYEREVLAYKPPLESYIDEYIKDNQKVFPMDGKEYFEVKAKEFKQALGTAYQNCEIDVRPKDELINTSMVTRGYQLTNSAIYSYKVWQRVI